MPRTAGWGGKRRDAGRKKKPGAGVSHLRRPKLTRHTPVHISLTVDPLLPSLRITSLREALEQCFAAALERFNDFQVTHYSIQGHHLHLVVEAHSAAALSRGMQGLTIRLARCINRQLGRKGRVFVDRYFQRILRTPREVRNCLVYVLLNYRKHAYQRTGRARRLPTTPDPCSSGRFFDGWRNASFAGPKHPNANVGPPGSWLLATGWRRHGLIELHDRPA